MTLMHRLWVAWDETGWREDPAAIVAEFPILNHLSDAIGLIEHAQRKAASVPEWRRPWFDAALQCIEAAFAERLGPWSEPGAEVL